MITPRQTRLVRAAGLRAFQQAIALAALSADVAAVRDTAVIVPGRAAARQLHRTFEQLWHQGCAGPASDALVLPRLLSRTEWYDELRRRLGRPVRQLAGFDREVLFRAAAREAAAAGSPPPFELRSGLIAEMAALYDALRRQHRTIDDFVRLVGGELEPVAGMDRGARRLLEQTHFLAAAWRGYERRLADGSLGDEHVLRTMLMRELCARPLRRVVVTVADHAADADGLWPADFALLTRLPGLEHVDVVATEELLAAGLHERLHRELPGLLEVRAPEVASSPSLVTPPAPAETRRFFVRRDREEELTLVARTVRAATRDGVTDESAAPRVVDDRTAVVFQRPLAYLYLARAVFDSAGIPWEADDALPLAAEPYAAALDLVCSFVTSGFTRASATALLRCPHLEFRVEGRPIDRAEIAALDRALAGARYAGDPGELGALAEAWSADGSSGTRRAARAAAALAAAAVELGPLTLERPAADHLTTLLEFLRTRQRPFEGSAETARRLRARHAVTGAIEALRAAHGRHDPEPCRFADLAAALRRWIESQTFAPRSGAGGLQLLDGRAARYGDFDAAFLIGLTELDWAERPARSIFYPAWLLAPLGWPRDAEARAARRAAFRDLLRLAARRVTVTTFALEDDGLVPVSPLVEELETCGLPVEVAAALPDVRIFPHEALALDPVEPAAVSGAAAAWLALRRNRSAIEAPAYHGSTGPRGAGRHSVSGVETYLECPFRYFAARVLRIDEPVEDEPVLGPRARGQFLHEVFQRFFSAWSARGRAGVPADELDAARALFADIVEECLASLPEADRAVERTRLLGSAAGTGLGERVLLLEIERPRAIDERLLEYVLEGEFDLLAADGAVRRVALKGVADRLDLFADGTFRVVDYKSARRPRPGRAVQLPVYGACAEQALSGHRGRRWRLAEAGYIAFGERRAFVPVVTSPADDELREGQGRFLQALDGIADGEFPPRPLEPFRCSFCPYPTVCRKDYVGDE